MLCQRSVTALNRWQRFIREKPLLIFSSALTGTDFSLQTLDRHLVAAGKLGRCPLQSRREKLFRNVKRAFRSKARG